MPLFSKGTATVARFEALGPVPDEDALFSVLESNQFRPFEDGYEEERMGFCDYRNPLLVPVNRGHFGPFDGWYYFGLRIDTRKIPPGILKAHVDLKIQNLMKERNLGFVGKEARVSIQDEVKAELLPKQTPTIKHVEIAYNPKGGKVWASSGGTKVSDFLVATFVTGFGLELQPVNPVMLAARLVPDIPTDEILEWEPLNVMGHEVSKDEKFHFLGQEFAIWLWQRHVEHGGRTASEEEASSVLYEDSMQLTSEDSQVAAKVRDVSLKKGDPAESKEGFEAMAAGLRPTKAKMRILDADREWVFNLAAGTMGVSSMKLPPSTAKSPADMADDRMFMIQEAFQHMERRFAEFLHARRDPRAMKESLDAWIQARLEGEGGEGVAPWEGD